ncbi:MAG: sugar transferase [Tissierellia bacterium]|nr:sugar transferase [Tissierellia bacterium]
MYKRYLKRPMDILLSLVTLIVLWPLILIIAVLVKIKLGSPIIFKQERVGLNEKIFTLYKFRTMTDARDEKGELLSDSARLTKFGKMLRYTSLDELPQLFNILKGDMSIIGPRPLLVEYLPFYKEYHKQRHSVRPGLSGLAQVNGRNAITWEDRFDLDVKYTLNITFLEDLKIIFLTLKKVYKKEGIDFDGPISMEYFEGSKEESFPL